MQWSISSLEKAWVALMAYKSQREANSSKWKQIRKRIIARDQGICAYCGVENATTVDHVLPVARGGDDSEANLVCACVKCNTSKGKKMPFDFFEPVSTTKLTRGFFVPENDSQSHD
jgi:5-methylcytosine-specific restriction endonuclease McrA